MSLFDIDNVFSRPLDTSIETRWERKANQAVTPKSAKTPRGSKTPLSSLSGKKASSKTPSRGSASYGDRFIPNANAMNSSLALHNITNNENVAPCSDKSGEFNSKLAQSLFAGDDVNSKILSFKNKAPAPSADFSGKLRVVYTANREKEASGVRRTARHIANTPERILDAPDMLDDYYLNLLDWTAPTASASVLAVGLGPCVYLWNAATGNIELLAESKDEDPVCSVSWMADGSHLAIGTSSNDVQLWNVERKKLVRTMKGHTARVSALSWNNHVLSSAGRDGMILHHDVTAREHKIATLRGHEQEICGLKWSPDGTQLASGANDNTCMIWDASTLGGGFNAAPEAKFRFTESQAAVKALAWCPWQKGVLATGSGTADRHIRFYNTLNGSLMNEVDTKSQVCSLLWSKDERELISGHGYSQNQLTVWKFPSMVKVTELTGHQSRVLHTALSPDGTTVVSGAADETLRFWKVWDGPAKKRAAAAGKDAAASRMALNLR